MTTLNPEKKKKRLSESDTTSEVSKKIKISSCEDKTEKKVKKEKKEHKEKKDKKKDKKEKARSSDSAKLDAPAQPSKVQASEKTEEKVKVVGDDSLKACATFAVANFPSQLAGLYKGFVTPTPIQSYCWPAILTGKDVVGIAETGSGKTLAFSLPALQMIFQQQSKGKQTVKMVVVAPTRELALQTFNVLKDSVPSVCIYGGMSKHDQRNELKSIRPMVVIGTPGRLVDFIGDETLNFSNVSHFVLDEADRMLDLGFADDIQKIAAAISGQHQTIMFSATWPTSIQSMASKYLRPDQIKIVIGDREAGENKACDRIQQIVEVIKDPMARDRRLLELLSKYHKNRKNRVIIFVLYKKEAARLENFLNRNGWTASSIHGDKPQVERTKCMDRFRDGTNPLLVATDVAARGLDIPNVEYVINFTFPLTIEDYIHRIGRTGRGGKEGIAHTLFTDNDKVHAGELVNVLRTSGAPVPEAMMTYNCVTKKKVHKEYGAFFKDVDPNAKIEHITFSDDD